MDLDQPVAGPSSTVEQTSDLPGRASSVPIGPQRFDVGYVYSVDMMAHRDPDGHDECPERISIINAYFLREQLITKMKSIPIRHAKKEEVLLAHSEDLWEKVISFRALSDEEVMASAAYYNSLSLYVGPSTTQAARLSCGGTIEACLAVARGEVQKAFANVRPPGHHAEPDEHMGFCFFNNVAVAAKVVQMKTKIKKILILDWDVHHGNGTQRAFEDDPSVLYISIHRYDNGTFYPTGTYGNFDSCGEGAGLGYSVNIPWPRGEMDDGDYLFAFQKIVMPIAQQFNPELVIISAGFDAAKGDNLGDCYVTPAGYAHMTHMLTGLAGGRVVVALEGGYNLTATAESAVAVTRVLLGKSPPMMPPLKASADAAECVFEVAKQQSKYWKHLGYTATDSREGLEGVTHSIPELLKAHRQHDLYTKYKMLEIPLADKTIEDAFGTQVMCTQDLFGRETLVVLIHEFGSLQMELQSVATCNAHLEKSFLIDFSKQLVKWVTDEGYSLIDVNLFPKPYAHHSSRGSTPEDLTPRLMIYLWDNYIQLSGAKNIILIGHGEACSPLIELVAKRSVSITRQVTALVQILGHADLAELWATRDPRNPISVWMRKASLLIVPSNHRDIGDLLPRCPSNKYIAFDEPKPIKLIAQSLPAIAAFIRSKLQQPVVDDTVAGLTKSMLLSEL